MTIYWDICFSIPPQAGFSIKGMGGVLQKAGFGFALSGRPPVLVDSFAEFLKLDYADQLSVGQCWEAGGTPAQLSIEFKRDGLGHVAVMLIRDADMADMHRQLQSQRYGLVELIEDMQLALRADKVVAGSIALDELAANDGLARWHAREMEDHPAEIHMVRGFGEYDFVKYPFDTAAFWDAWGEHAA